MKGIAKLACGTYLNAFWVHFWFMSQWSSFTSKPVHCCLSTPCFRWGGWVWKAWMNKLEFNRCKPACLCFCFLPQKSVNWLASNRCMPVHQCLSLTPITEMGKSMVWVNWLTFNKSKSVHQCLSLPFIAEARRSKKGSLEFRSHLNVF